MNCEEYRAFLPDAVEGGLSETGAACLDLHASACTACAAEVQEHARIADRIRTLPLLPPPARLADRAVASALPEPWFSPTREALRIAAAAAALVAITLGIASVDIGRWVGRDNLDRIEAELHAPVEKATNQMDLWIRKWKE